MKKLLKALSVLIIFLSAGFSHQVLVAQSKIIMQQGTIKQAFIEMQVANYVVSKTKIDHIINQYQGYTSSEKENIFTTKLANQLIVRIPNEKFTMVVNELVKEARIMQTKKIDLIDIAKETEQIKSKVEAKEIIKRKYTEMLNQTKTVINVTQLEKNIEELNTEIDILLSRQLEIQQPEYSLVEIKLSQLLPKSKSSSFDSLTNIAPKAKNQLTVLIAIFVVLQIVTSIFAYRFYNKYKVLRRKVKRTRIELGS